MRQVVFSKDVCGGEPRVDETRLSCAAVVDILQLSQLSLERFLGLYPYLTPEDINNCLSYCARRQCVFDRPHNFCHGCVLDQREEDSLAIFIDAGSLEKASTADDGYAFLGTVGEYLETEQRREYWELAEDLRQKLFQTGPL